MTLNQCGVVIGLLACMASAAESQTVFTPNPFPTRLATPNPFAIRSRAMGPQLPGGSPAIGPSDANGAAPFYPTQIQQAYGISSLLAAGNNGAGQTIAIVDAYDYPSALSTLNTFSQGYNSAWSIPQMTAPGGTGPTFTQLNETGGTALPGTDSSKNNWEYEEALDIESAHAIAPQANIVLYEANTSSYSDMMAAVNTAKSNPAVSVVSMSWGAGEFQSEKNYDSYFTTPGSRGASGVTFVAATGDGGAPGNYPAFSPNVVAVGGTSLRLNAANNYSSESAWSWSKTNSWGAGGGTSTVQGKPIYQASYGTLNGGLLATTTSRATPDVSMVADPNTGALTYDSYNGGWFEIGGTSLATPCFAGLVAIANQIRSNAGQPSLDGPLQTLPALYNISSNAYHDITSGNISRTGNAAYSATVGYDLATGLGSPVANELVPGLADYGLVTSTSYSVAVSPGTQNVHLPSGGNISFSITGSIANTGGSGADQLVFSGFGFSASGGTLSSSLPVTGGMLAPGSGTSATTTFSSNTAGSFTITPTASNLGNLTGRRTGR